MSILNKLKTLFKKEDKKIITAEELDEKQKIIDELYKKQGNGEPSDEVLAMQVELNQLRNKLNIPDKNNLNEEGWSQ